MMKAKTFLIYLVPAVRLMISFVALTQAYSNAHDVFGYTYFEYKDGDLVRED